MNEQQTSTKSTTSLTQRLDVNFALQAAGLGVWEVDQLTNQVIWDERCRAFFGLTNDEILTYEQTLQYIHPDDVVRVDRAVKWAMNAESGGHYDQTYRTLSNDQQIRWVRFTGKADFTEHGTVSRFAGVAQDMNSPMQIQQQLQQSEQFYRHLIEEASVATMLMTGPDHVIELANQQMLAMLGKGAAILGKPAVKAVPELADQAYLDLLNHVFTSGVTVEAKAMPGQLVNAGVVTLHYFDFTYKPLRNATGDVYGILATAIDVTQQVVTQQQKEEAIAALRNAIELAELGTFSIDLATGLLTVSPRVADWFGFDSLTADTDVFINGVGEADRDPLRAALDKALRPGSDGRYDIVHSVINARTGQQRMLHALGRIHTDTIGNPLKLEGTAQDITAERALQQVLEQQVLQRTKELAATNQELAASNEEYAVINEELEEANNLLSRSNDNLQTFAYVASHDLQEPLRKIQQFGDLLQSQYGPTLGDGVTYLQRMQLAASRMSTLIKDLLGFSRIATQRNTDEPVPLDTVIGHVLSVLDLAIAEASAQVLVDALPVVSGDATQLGQLFQNLLSNALKFHRPGVPPYIHISSQPIAAEELPPSVKPLRRTPAYHRIEVTDNGIGFEEKYLDRIFQVFQRLHGRNEFAGTGVGLAICEKVVSNHGGVITATSQPGQGTTFIIYLPAL